jgi:hypothetical protein
VKIIQLFWNKEEKRLRAFWRLAIHSLLIMLFTGIPSFVFLLWTIFFSPTSVIDIVDVFSSSSLIQWTNSRSNIMIVLSLINFTGILGSTLIVGKWIDRRKFSNFGINFSKHWWMDFAFGLGLGAGLMGFIFLTGWLTGSLRVTGFFITGNQKASFVFGLIEALFLFVLVGIYEELLSRGYHLINLAEGFNHPRLGQRKALLLAYGISSLLFGVLHLGNPNATWLSVINISLAGAFLGLGMLLTGSLAIPIGLHITWNFFQGNIFGFSVSGLPTGLTLIETEVIKNSWLIGGSFGPESGLISLIAMLIGSVFIVLWTRRKNQIILQTDLAKYAPPNEADPA